MSIDDCRLSKGLVLAALRGASPNSNCGDSQSAESKRNHGHKIKGSLKPERTSPINNHARIANDGTANPFDNRQSSIDIHQSNRKASKRTRRRMFTVYLKEGGNEPGLAKVLVSQPAVPFRAGSFFCPEQTLDAIHLLRPSLRTPVDKDRLYEAIASIYRQSRWKRGAKLAFLYSTS